MAILDTYTGITAAWSMDRVLLASFGAGAKYTTATGISSWNDQSGNARHLVQATAANQPLAITTVGGRGRMSASFDGTNDVFTGAAISNFVTASAGYIVCVIFPRVVTTTGSSYDNDAVFTDSATAVPGIGLNFHSGGYVIANHYAGGSPATVSTRIPINSIPLVVEWKHESGSLFSRVNGEAWSSATSGNTFVLTNTLRVGASITTYSFYTDIAIFEMVCFNAIPSVAQQDALVADMAAHYCGTNAFANKLFMSSAYQQQTPASVDIIHANKLLLSSAYQRTDANSLINLLYANKLLISTAYRKMPFYIAGDQLKVTSMTGFNPGVVPIFVRSTDAVALVQEEPFNIYILEVGAPALHSQDVTAVRSTELDFTVTTTGSTGTIYWVAVRSRTQPTPAQIIAGQDYESLPADDSGTIAVSSSGVKNSTAIGLISNEDYCVHLYQIAADSKVSNIVTAGTAPLLNADFLFWDGPHVVVENTTIGTAIGGPLTVTDPAMGSVTYSLINNAGGRYGISGSSIVVAGVIDFETSALDTIVVRATDGSRTYDELFTITVTNVHDTMDSITFANDFMNGITKTDGDLGLAPTAGQSCAGFSRAYKSSGKHYFEVTYADIGNNGGEGCGLAPDGAGVGHVWRTYPRNATIVYGSGSIWSGGVSVATGLGTAVVGDEFCFAVDLDNSRFWARRNAGNWNGNASANPATNVGGIDIGAYRASRVAPFVHFPSNSFSSGAKYLFNFGATAFTQAVPAGFTDGWKSLGGVTVEPEFGHHGHTYLSRTVNCATGIEIGGVAFSKKSTGSDADVVRAPLTDFLNSGKYYFEFHFLTVVGASANVVAGVMTNDASAADVDIFSPTNCGVVTGGGAIWSNGANTGKTLGALNTAGVAVGIAVDLDNEKVWFRKLPAGNWNGLAIGSENPETNTGGASISNYVAKTMGPYGYTFSNDGDGSYKFNFGNEAFVGAVPAGFTSGWPSAGVAIPKVRYCDHLFDANSINRTAYIGDPASDRLVVAVVCHDVGSPPGNTISSVDIGGEPATVHVQLAANPTFGAAGGIASRLVPTGTTVDIAAAVDSTSTPLDIIVYTITGLASTTPIDTATATGSGNVPFQLDTGAGGVVIAGSSGDIHLGTSVYGGAVADDVIGGTLSISGGAGVDTPAQINYTVYASGGANNVTGYAVSWR